MWILSQSFWFESLSGHRLVSDDFLDRNHKTDPCVVDLHCSLAPSRTRLLQLVIFIDGQNKKKKKTKTNRTKFLKTFIIVVLSFITLLVWILLLSFEYISIIILLIFIYFKITVEQSLILLFHFNIFFSIIFFLSKKVFLVFLPMRILFAESHALIYSFKWHIFTNVVFLFHTVGQIME